MTSRKTAPAVLPLDPVDSLWARSRDDLPLVSPLPSPPVRPAAPASLSPAPVQSDPLSPPAPVEPGTLPSATSRVSSSSRSASSSDSGVSAPVIATSSPARGQDAAPRLTDPPSSSTPVTLSRGPAPWSDNRVAALLGQGTLQAAWLPDIRATAPTRLQIQNAQQREMLRFSNAIANTGANNWQVRRGTPLTDPAQIAAAEALGLDPSQLALTSQELLDSQGEIAAVITDAALSEFHPEHRHFHIGETAEFALEKLNSSTRQWDPLTGLEVVKTTFCLIDVNQIQQVPGGDPDHYDTIKSPANANVYNDCYADVQGIQDGWIDRYHHALPGQEVDITDLAAGTYRLVTRVNPAGWFLESDYSNNVGWTTFTLSRDSNGNGKLREIPGATGGIWFDSSSNGMG